MQNPDDRRRALDGALQALDAALARGGQPGARFVGSLVTLLPPDRVEGVADFVRGEILEELAALEGPPAADPATARRIGE